MAAKGHIKGIIIPCKKCGSDMYVMPYLIKSGRKKFCSKKCLYESGSQTMTFVKGHADFVPKELRGHTLDTKLKIGISGIGKHLGELNGNWIVDRSKVKLDKERGGTLHKQWSKNIKNRDSWKCKINNAECCGKVIAHHILSWAKFPELRYELNNGITLCHFHHPRKRNDEIKLAPTFSGMVLTSAN